MVRSCAGFFSEMLSAHVAFLTRVGYLRHSNTYEKLVGAGLIAVIATVSGPLLTLAVPFVIFVALLRSDRGTLARLLMSHLFQFLGRISYSIYMVHSFVVVCFIMVLNRLLSTHGFPTASQRVGLALANVDPWLGDVPIEAMVTSVVLIAFLTYSVIQEPGRTLGRRLVRNSERLMGLFAKQRLRIA
jgi:peptidoglycan/LPS O-acetylase OafA/YrhL